MSTSQQPNDVRESKDAGPGMTHFATYYRWLVIDKYLRLDVRAAAVLDAGCGDGYLLSRIGAPLAVGVELHPGATIREDVRMVRADAQSLPFARGRFYRVLALELMEHLESPERFLAEARRVLGTGGALWFSTPSDHFGLSPWFMTRIMEDRWGHRRRGFSRAELWSMVPEGAVATVVPWNEPIFRRTYLAIKLISLISGPLALRATAACAALDNRFREGDGGRYFVRVAFNE